MKNVYVYFVFYYLAWKPIKQLIAYNIVIFTKSPF